MKIQDVAYGNVDLLQRRIIAFLSSKMEERLINSRLNFWLDTLTSDDVVMVGNANINERYVLDQLLFRKVPVIYVFVYPVPTLTPEILTAVEENRYLAINLPELTGQQFGPDEYMFAKVRNSYIISQAKELIVGYMRPFGKLYGLLKELKTNIPISYLAFQNFDFERELCVTGSDFVSEYSKVDIKRRLASGGDQMLSYNMKELPELIKRLQGIYDDWKDWQGELARDPFKVW